MDEASFRQNLIFTYLHGVCINKTFKILAIQNYNICVNSYQASLDCLGSKMKKKKHQI